MAWDTCTSRCPEGYVNHQPSRLCYKAFNNRTTYNGAVSRCSSDGGTLAMPRDNATNNFLIELKNAVDKNALFRFGLTDYRQEGVWVWDDNVPLGDFSAWGLGEPNNENNEDCAEYFPDSSSKNNSWNDGPCAHDDRKFICQFSAKSDYCIGESVDTEAGQVTFSRTDGGSFSYSAERCNSSEGYEKPLASRFCWITQNGAAVWDQPVLLTCDIDLRNLSQIVVNNETALSVATELQVITTQAETLSSGDVNTIITIVQKIVNASATEQIGDSLLTTVDNLIKVNATVLQQSQEERRGPTRAVQALETFADTVILTTDTYTAVRPGVALQATDISPEELDKGQGFAFFLSGNESTSLTEGNVTSFTTEDGGDIQQTADVSIALPPNISNMIQINSTSEVRLSYTLYNSSSLFVQPSQGAARPSQGSVGTRIIGGRIAGRPVKNLPEPVIITFTALQSFLSEDVKGVTCVFWDFEAEAGQGAWSTEGCENIPSETKGRYTCACNHLTNFALLFRRRTRSSRPTSTSTENTGERGLQRQPVTTRSARKRKNVLTPPDKAKPDKLHKDDGRLDDQRRRKDNG